ncbi:hypothetical protein MD535_24015 [Vibrio sp. ZSDZ65]|uniref:Uncharacterized protein n=1 Tax=Vibrio qingdaonensis TaxID=2829491 RepID=A0A9X3CT92_9VIBR|nr:hypothetical protein [Vibrio qingdaonensis]MCW8349060.1 hypothetical protein [Vibrio qingdaonensis]
MISKSRFVFSMFLLIFLNQSVEANVNIDTYFSYSPSTSTNGFAKASNGQPIGNCSSNQEYANDLGFTISNYNSGGGHGSYWISALMRGTIETTLRKRGTNDTVRVRLHPYALYVDHRAPFVYKAGQGSKGSPCSFRWLYPGGSADRMQGFFYARNISPTGSSYVESGAYFRRTTAGRAYAGIALEVLETSSVIKAGEYIGYVDSSDALQFTRTSSYYAYKNMDNSNISISMVVDKAFDFRFFGNGVSINPNNGNSNSGRINFSANTNVDTYVTVNCLNKKVDIAGKSCFLDPEEKLRLSVALGFNSSSNVQQLDFGQRAEITRLMGHGGLPQYDLGYFDITIDGFNDAVRGRNYVTSLEVLFEEKL